MALATIDAQTVGAIAAVTAAIIAIAAAVSARLSADRSAKAAERSATAAEDALAIEGERLEHEREERAERNLPTLDAGAEHGGMWMHRRGVLAGVVENLGPTTAIIQHIDLEAGGRRLD